MSKTWYPVINYTQCTACKVCYNKCTHEVFALKEERPVVVKPEECVHGCHGCGNLCPQGAIAYVGEAVEAEGCSCNCNCSE